MSIVASVKNALHGQRVNTETLHTVMNSRQYIFKSDLDWLFVELDLVTVDKRLRHSQSSGQLSSIEVEKPKRVTLLKRSFIFGENYSVEEFQVNYVYL